jgi:hypothetical protein
MYLISKKYLTFKISNYFIGNVLLYVARIPRNNFLYVEQAYPAKPPGKFVPIADFIMAHHTNKLRAKASEFVFETLEWRDNVCIRSAIENNLIEDLKFDTNPRIINGEVWTDTDYALKKLVNHDPLLLPFQEYPELPYGVTELPPYALRDQTLLTPLKPAHPNIRFPTMFFLNQLRKNKLIANSLPDNSVRSRRLTQGFKF